MVQKLQIHYNKYAKVLDEINHQILLNKVVNFNFFETPIVYPAENNRVRIIIYKDKRVIYLISTYYTVVTKIIKKNN